MAFAALENDLGNTPAGEGEKLEAMQDDYYYKLQAYLMPAKQERVDPKFLEERLGAYSKEKPSDRGRMENLAFYALNRLRCTTMTTQRQCRARSAMTQLSKRTRQAHQLFADQACL
ncbi:MAG: hypothetical protein U0Y68_17630 [Blastocatellia bacterium]